MSLYQRTPSQVMSDVIECMVAGLVPMVASSPGLGKSSIYFQIAEDYRLWPIDLRLSQCTPEDLMGLPMRTKDGNKASFVPFNMFPLVGDTLPEGYDGWMLILDEFNSATKAVQAAAYKLVFDRMVGQEKLHENVVTVCAGNLATDRAIVNSLSTAMQSRLVHIEMVASPPDFLAHAHKNNFDTRVSGFIEFQPSYLHQFKPDHQDKTFACPRTWEFASKLIKGKPFKDVNLALLAGTLSEGVAIVFHTFLKEFDSLPAFKDIMADPGGTIVPDKTSTRHALLTMILEYVDDTSFENISKYLKRFPPEMQVMYFRGVVQRFPKMKETQIFAENILHLTRFFNEDEFSLAA